MGNVETSCTKYLCQDQREVPNEEAYVFALTLYRVNNTYCYINKINYVINEVNVNILETTLSMFCMCILGYVYVNSIITTLKHRHGSALKADIRYNELPGSHVGYYSQLSCMFCHHTVL